MTRKWVLFQQEEGIASFHFFLFSFLPFPLPTPRRPPTRQHPHPPRFIFFLSLRMRGHLASLSVHTYGYESPFGIIIPIIQWRIKKILLIDHWMIRSKKEKKRKEQRKGEKLMIYFVQSKRFIINKTIQQKTEANHLFFYICS